MELKRQKSERDSAYSLLSECLPLAASAYCSQNSSTARLLSTSTHSALPALSAHSKAERQKSSIKCGRYQLSLPFPSPFFSSLSLSSPFGLFPSGRAVQFTFPLSILISISLLLAFFSLFFIVAFLLLLHSPSPFNFHLSTSNCLCLCSLSLSFL